MAQGPVRAITFDLWDTIFIDDSDEPKRTAAGQAPKPVERRNLVESFLAKHQPVARERIDLAYDTTDAAFRQVWYGQNITWTVAERLGVLLKGLRRELPPGELADLVRRHEEMELAFRPDIAEDIGPALSALHGRYKLGVISDTIFSPGRVLRQLLEHYGLLCYFDFFVFSDELGCAKPNPLVFEAAANGLGVASSEIVHVGDREEKDIGGPHAVGARGILSTAVVDRGAERTRADAVCRHYRDLARLVDRLDR